MTKPDREGGFVLTEALAALTLAAIVGAALIAALHSTSTRAAEARVRAQALLAAEMHLAEALNDQRVGGADGKTGQLVWRRTITPYGALTGLENVAVDVEWRTLGRQGHTQLSGVRIASPPSP